MLSSGVAVEGRRVVLLPETAITTAVTDVTTTPLLGAGIRDIVAQCTFVYGSGGTGADFYLQTSFDGGTTWTDIQCFSFTTTSATKFQVIKSPIAVAANQAIQDGALTANSILDGVMGDRLRVKYSTTGTYAGGTTIKVDALIKG